MHCLEEKIQHLAQCICAFLLIDEKINSVFRCICSAQRGSIEIKFQTDRYPACQNNMMQDIKASSKCNSTWPEKTIVKGEF